MEMSRVLEEERNEYSTKIMTFNIFIELDKSYPITKPAYFREHLGESESTCLFYVQVVPDFFCWSEE